MLVDTPVICAVRSMAVAIEKPTATARAATEGGGGNIVILTGPEGSDVPPGPVAVNVKLSGPT